jgi:Leucine-rich repeat (LRR) protein
MMLAVEHNEPVFDEHPDAFELLLNLMYGKELQDSIPIDLIMLVNALAKKYGTDLVLYTIQHSKYNSSINNALKQRYLDDIGNAQYEKDTVMAMYGNLSIETQADLDVMVWRSETLFEPDVAFGDVTCRVFSDKLIPALSKCLINKLIFIGVDVVVSARIFANMHLENLSFEKCSVRIDPGGLSGIDDRINTLTMTRCNVSALDSAKFQINTSIREIRIVDVHFTDHPTLPFISSSVGGYNKPLDLSRCMGETTMFVSSITLDNCGLSSVSVQLGNALRMTKLVITNNWLTSPPHTSMIPSLRELDLSCNEITSIEDHAFDNNAALRTLFLYENALTTIPSTVFSRLCYLVDLDLSYNKINVLDSTVFVGLRQLEELTLDNNQLTTLPSTIFDPLVNLVNLYLSNNQLTVIDSNAFEGLVNLEILDLNGNQLTTIDPLWLKDLKLKTLNLRHNLITKIKSRPFNAVAKTLKTLFLANNQISDIGTVVFNNPLNVLRVIDLDDNKLSTCPESRLYGLHRLSLRGNRSITIPSSAYMPNLKVLTIDRDAVISPDWNKPRQCVLNYPDYV